MGRRRTQGGGRADQGPGRAGFLSEASWKKTVVLCREESRSREKPIAVEVDGQRLKVREIIDRWYEQGPQSGSETINYFKIDLADGQTVLLRCLDSSDWFVKRLNH